MSDETTRTTAGAAGRALVPYGAVAASRRGALRPWHYLALAGSLVAVFCIGAGGTHLAQLAWAHMGRGHAVVQADATAQTLHRLEDEIARLKGSVDSMRASQDVARQDDALRTLKHTVETLKGDLQQARAADGSSLQQIAQKLDRPEQAAKLAEIAARLDRIEHEPARSAVDPAQAKLADLSTRVDRIEHAVTAPTTTGSILQPARATNVTTVARTPDAPAPKLAEVAAAKPQPTRSARLDAWVVRDVYDGMALLEGRRGGLREVGPGEFLPGAGQVRSIERHGRTWVVMTSEGMIGTDTF